MLALREVIVGVVVSGECRGCWALEERNETDTTGRAKGWQDRTLAEVIAALWVVFATRV